MVCTRHHLRGAIKAGYDLPHCSSGGGGRSWAESSRGAATLHTHPGMGGWWAEGGQPSWADREWRHSWHLQLQVAGDSSPPHFRPVAPRTAMALRTRTLPVLDHARLCPSCVSICASESRATFFSTGKPNSVRLGPDKTLAPHHPSPE